jgi:hypothetical protein
MQLRLRLYLEGKTLEALQARAGQEYRKLEAQATVELMRALGTWGETKEESPIPVTGDAHGETRHVQPVTG